MKKLTLLGVMALLCVYLNTLLAQNIITISGTVRNAVGEPLSGATVTNTRTGKGTVTGASGAFTLHGTHEKDKLRISYIGYFAQTITMGNERKLVITLKDATNELDKVVVQAYGTTNKRLSTGNIGSVSGDEIRKQSLMNPIQAIQGLVPGAMVTNSGGAASGVQKIEIRGRNNIDPSMVAEPLYIIDGVPMTILNISNNIIKAEVGGSAVSMGSIQSGVSSQAAIGQSPYLNLNATDIESIEVLKDADATAIYGSRGSNGVILITTKKGKAGATKLELNAFAGISKVTHLYDLLNTQQYLQIRREALKNDDLPIDEQNAPDLVVWDTTRYTNWQKFMWGSLGKRSSLNATLSGGDTRTNFRINTGYDYARDIGTVKGGNYRGAVTVNLNHFSANRRFGISWTAMYTITQINPVNKTGPVLLPPNAPAVYDDVGRLNYQGWQPLSSHYPFQSLRTEYQSDTRFLNSNIMLSYELAKGLKLTTSIGYNHSVTQQFDITPISAQNPDYSPKGSHQKGNTLFRNLISEPHLSYKQFVGKGNLTLLAGATAQHNITDGLLIFGANYANDLLINSINNAPTKAIISNLGEYKYSGVFSRVNYNWANKYIINLNTRRDGSSRFGPGRQFGNFGSVGAAWIITEEPWMKKYSWLSFGKLRSSYGITGSDQIGDYQYLPRWAVNTNGKYNEVLPVNPISLYDSLLQWEVNRKLEAGLSLGFWNDRLVLDVSWYRNHCNNQLVPFPTSAFTGFNAVTSNTPANVQNTGTELVLSGKPVDGENFKWQTQLLIGINRNKLLSYPNFSQSPYKAIFEIGKPLFIARLLHTEGVDPATGEYIFEDKNKDGIIEHNAFVADNDLYPFIMSPIYDGSWSTELGYKNWSLSFRFYFRKQNGISIYAGTELPGTMSNQPAPVMNHWQKEGDIAPYAKLSTYYTLNTNRYFNYSDARISDASFIRLQNVSLAYQFPENRTSRLLLKGARFYVQGSNLFFISRYDGIDPEVQIIGAMPIPAMLTAGFSINL